MSYRSQNQSSAGQSSRGQNPRPGAGRRGDYRQRLSDNVVTPEPVASDAFTFERVQAFQCVAGMQYTVPEICDEKQYFTQHAARTIIAINNDAITPKSTLLLKAVEAVESLIDQDDELEMVLKLMHVQYGQLAKKVLTEAQVQRSRNPPANNTAYVPEENFESFKVCMDASGNQIKEKSFVQAPQSEGGWYAELTGDRGLKFKVVLEFMLKIDMNVDEDGEGPYGPLAPRRTRGPVPPI